MKVADLQTEAAQRYTDLPLELDDGSTIKLRNLIRLDDTARKNAQVLLDALNSKGEEGKEDLSQLTHQERALDDLFLLVADEPKAMRGLLDGWDLAVKLLLVERWTEATQAPEAPSSSS